MNGEVNGTFIQDDRPRNGATAKLWQAAGFGAPPAKDDDEPNIAFQVGATLTTDVEYGGDGAYRWTGVAEGSYYVSCFYDGHRYWEYHSVEIDVSFEELDSIGDVGTGAAQISYGNHTH